jgi:hypothetical protein
MSRCRICRFDTELDDVVLRFSRGACLCLRCYHRETAAACSMPKALQRAVIATLAHADAAERPNHGGDR